MDLAVTLKPAIMFTTPSFFPLSLSFSPRSINARIGPKMDAPVCNCQCPPPPAASNDGWSEVSALGPYGIIAVSFMALVFSIVKHFDDRDIALQTLYQMQLAGGGMPGGGVPGSGMPGGGMPGYAEERPSSKAADRRTRDPARP